MSAAAQDARPPAPVTAVIPTFNRAADLERALAHLARQSAGPLCAVVVDNGSTDNTREVVEALAPAWEGRLRYIHHDPRGPAAARNTGLRAVETPFVLFVDSDVDLDHDWVERALAHFRDDPRLGAAGGYILYAFDPGRVNAYGGDLGRMGLAWDVDECAALDPARGSADRIWINCSAMIARADAVREGGGFDEAFFYAYEDSDIGWRLNLMGHRVAVFPDLRAWHNVGEDSGALDDALVFHCCKNRLRSMIKNASAARLAGMLAGYAAFTAADVLARPPRAPKLRALGWNLARLGETLALRRQVQARRVVADAVVFGLGSRRWLPPTPLGGRRRRNAGKPPGEADLVLRPEADDRP